MVGRYYFICAMPRKTTEGVEGDINIFVNGRKTKLLQSLG